MDRADAQGSEDVPHVIDEGSRALNEENEEEQEDKEDSQERESHEDEESRASGADEGWSDGKSEDAREGIDKDGDFEDNASDADEDEDDESARKEVEALLGRDATKEELDLLSDTE